VRRCEENVFDPALETRIGSLLEAGDAAAATTDVLRSLGPSMVRYLRSVLRDEAAVADAFSQCAENLWKGLPSFRGESSLRTWALRLARNAALNHRHEAWCRQVRRFATGEASRLAEEIRTTTAIRVERQRRALDDLREALTPDERSLLSLRIDQELSWSEIAAVMSTGEHFIDAATLMKRYERLKARLATMAREQGLID
jgi:RNA polymerase sigma-70 factor (ECF subfamily)